VEICNQELYPLTGDRRLKINKEVKTAGNKCLCNCGVTFTLNFFGFVHQFFRWDKFVFKRPQLHKHKRVCLEHHSVVGVMMLYKRWKTFRDCQYSCEVERTELADEINQKKRIELPQTTVRSSLQITFCCIERKLSLW
jgi:hypothetical protein